LDIVGYRVNGTLPGTALAGQACGGHGEGRVIRTGLPMNHLYFGDNLAVLREHIADARVDLIYLDPPFNANASWHVLFKGPEGTQSQAQIEAFRCAALS
jgi:hypothetical protein